MHMVEIIYLTRLIIFLPFSCVVTSYFLGNVKYLGHSNRFFR